jgi:hypothetical protein
MKSLSNAVITASDRVLRSVLSYDERGYLPSLDETRRRHGCSYISRLTNVELQFMFR